MSTETTIARGFALLCPHCGEEHTMRLDLADLDTVTCTSCEDEMSIGQIRQMVAGWTKLIAWIDQAPPQE